MTKQQTQKVRQQLRAKFKNDFTQVLKTMTAEDLDNMVARAIANRQVTAMQEARP